MAFLKFLNVVLYNDVFFALQFTCLTIVILMILRDLSKLGAVLTSLSLIGLAAWITYHMQAWLPIAEGMVGKMVRKQLQLTPDQVKEFEYHVNFFLWLLPFVTAAFGTNMLSDALLKKFTYQDHWFVWHAILNLRSGKSIFGSRKYFRLPLDERLCISRSARRDLQRFIAKLPQFVRVGETDRIINLTDGSVVMPYVPSTNSEVFECKLTVAWQKERAPIDVDARQYLEVQLQFATTMGSNAARLRREADDIFERIVGRDW